MDFVNTELIAEGARKDLLATMEDVVAWCRTVGIVTPSGSARSGNRKKATDNRTLEALRDLRRCVRAVLEALSGGNAPSEADLLCLNTWLTKGSAAQRLRWKGGGFEMVTERAEGLGDLPGRLAAEAAAFFVTCDPARVRACSGSGCILFFYDSSKNGKRRWCAMQTCGNREKVSRYRSSG